MPGGLIGVYGQQRSGKTLFAYLLALKIHDELLRDGYDIRIYTNLLVYPNDDIKMVHVNSISEIPLDLEPKILILDEIYNGTDANDFRKLKEISIFINTVGKQNMLLIFTSIDDMMVFNRIRNQVNMAVLVKKSNGYIFYRIVNPSSMNVYDFKIKICPELFKRVHYDTNFIPLSFNWKMDTWKDKLIRFYKDSFGVEVTLDDIE